MLEGLLTFCAAFALYAASAAPSVTFGDAGEFAAAAASLGLPHAPDYPFYTLAARAFGEALRLGNWAYRTNLFSAAAAAAALVVLGAALRRLRCSAVARAAALLALGLCPLWRYEAAVTEVFALHLLLCAVILWLLARYADRTCGLRPAAALGLVFGLGAGNHQTLALAAPAVVAQAAASRPSVRAAVRAAGLLVAFAVVGFCVYAYLPVRSMKGPPLDWDHPATARGFTRALLRSDYGSLSLTVEGRGAGTTPELPRPLMQLERWAAAAASQLGLPLLIAAALGFLLWPGRRGDRWTLLIWVIALGPLFLWMGDPPFDAQTSGALERFYLASWIGVAALAAGGVELIRKRSAALGWLAGALIVWSLARPRTWQAAAPRWDLASYDYGRSIQNSLPPRAALFMDGGDDTFYSLAFLDYAQRRREDVELHDRGGLVFPSAYGADFRGVPAMFKEPVREAVEAPLAEQGRLFYSTLNEKLLPRYPLRVWGLLRRPYPPSLTEPVPDLWAVYPTRFSPELLRAHYRDRALAAVYPFQRAAADAQSGDLDAAYAHLAQAWALAPDASWTAPDIGYQAGMLGYRAVAKRRWFLARALYELWADCDPAAAEPLLDLGVVFEKTHDDAGAERLYLKAQALEPASPRPSYSLGALYWRQGRWADAADALGRAHQLSPSDARIAAFAAEAARRAQGHGGAR